MGVEGEVERRPGVLRVKAPTPGPGVAGADRGTALGGGERKAVGGEATVGDGDRSDSWPAHGYYKSTDDKRTCRSHIRPSQVRSWFSMLAMSVSASR